MIGATPFTAQSRLKDVEFDTVIFDEAGQITLPLAVMGMLSGTTYIFVGDHKQLPPVLHSEENKEEGRSIFNYLRGRGFEDVLNVTYRMNEAITTWPSEQFYLGQLNSHPSVAARRLHYSPRGGELDRILDPNDPVVFVELPVGEDKTSSHEEAILIVSLVQELVKVQGMSSREIGVVIPFRKQSRTIRRRLQDQGRNDPAFADLVVDTVERMQGQEREMVIVGLTCSDPSFTAKINSFILQPNRLNVCFTRARSKLVVIGSRSLLQAYGEESPELAENRERLRSFVSGVRHIAWS